MTNKNLNKSKVGKLKSETIISIHTDIALTLWNGKRNENVYIVPIPACIKRLESVDQTSKQTSFSKVADAYKNAICAIIDNLDESIGLERDRLDVIFRSLPKRIKINEPESLAPKLITFYSKSTVAYQLIYTLVSFDELITQALHARHIGLLSQLELNQLLKTSTKNFRRVLTMINSYKPFENIENATSYFASRGLKIAF